MATHINYGPGERASFELVPETCPAVERAIEAAFRPVMFNAAAAEAIFEKYHLDPPQGQMLHALHELVGRVLFDRKRALTDVVLYEGTFPLRAALVRQVEQVQGIPPGRNRFEEWIEDQNSRKAYRAANQSTQGES